MNNLRSSFRYVILAGSLCITLNTLACKKSSDANKSDKTENALQDDGSVKESWVKQNLRKSGPKIILTNELLQEIKTAVNSDDAIKAYYQYLYANAVSMINLPVLERKLEGRRLLMK